VVPNDNETPRLILPEMPNHEEKMILGQDLLHLVPVEGLVRGMVDLEPEDRT